MRSALGLPGLLEIVVVDDGSTDDTSLCASRVADALRAAGDPPLHVRTQARSGPAGARNLGASVAKGDVLGFLDADDLCLVGQPDSRRAALKAGSAVALGMIQCVSGEPPVPTEIPYEGFQLGAALIRRDAFESVGPFDSAVEPAEDLDWFLRAREAGVPIAFTSEVVLGYRLQPGSLTSAADGPQPRVAAGPAPLGRPAPDARGAASMSAVRPSVSVLLPVLNGEPYLGPALQAMAAQTLPADEILVLDGGSTDGTRERALREDGVTLVDLPGTSCLEALNLGLAQATGELIAFTSSDDVMAERALEQHVAALVSDEGAGYSYGNIALFADDGGVSNEVPTDLAGSVQPARVIEAMMVRRAVLDAIGGFRTDLGTSGDLEWVARLGDLGIRPAYVDAVVLAKRLHRQNLSYTERENSAGITRSLRESILRKRGG